MTVIDMTDHEHCLEAGQCWQTNVPCPSLTAERRVEDGKPISAMTQCGTCRRWWDDAIITSMTPVPSGRCPFEAEHEDEDEEPRAPHDPYHLWTRVYEAMHYAGRAALKTATPEEIRALLDYNEGNAWIQDVAEEELDHRG